MRKRLTQLVTGALLVVASGVLAGCGGSSKPSTELTAAAPTFSPPGGTYNSAQTITLSSATQGAAIYYTVDGTTPTATATRYSSAISVSSSETLEAVAVLAGQQSSTVASAQYVIQASATLSANSYTFPSDAVGNAEVETVATLTNPGATAITLSSAITGDPSFTLSSTSGCGATLAADTSCALVAQYLPTAAGAQTGALTVTYSGGAVGTATVALSGAATAIAAATAAQTSNPLVALYTVKPGFAATVTVQFGPDTTYGYSTFAVPTSTSSPAAPVQVEVAGMKQNTTYHMRAAIAYAGGNIIDTGDTTFTTGALPATLASLPLVATTAAGQTPQPGVEIMEPVLQAAHLPYATDLQGNIIWYYPWADYPGSPYINDGLKQLPNGDFLGVFSVNDSTTFANSPPDPGVVSIREFDLIGNTIKQITVSQLNTELAAMNYKNSLGKPLLLEDFHHDITPLPNGHWLVLSNTVENVPVNGTNTNVLGDVVIDLDTNLQPVFVWNEFDHLDVTRQPLNFPDWTHSNALVYSPTDGNFIISVRHQNWLLKVDYQNGAGTGAVLWHLGYQGDFTLIDTVDTPPSGVSPFDPRFYWQYAQHGPSLVNPTLSAGTFDMVLMDNGNDRIQAENLNNCSNPANCYTTVPRFTINEDAKTVTVDSRIVEPLNLYSNFGGNAEVLANGDLEYDLAGPAAGAHVIETLQDTGHTQVWSLTDGSGFLYRAFRLPSLYSGVQWP